MALWKARLTTAALAAVALLSASAAKAQTACESLPNPIYILGSSASQPLWNLLGPVLSADGTTLVYQKPGSCNGVNDIESNQSGTPALMASAANGSVYWYSDGGIGACTATNDTVDVGVSDVFQSTCDAINGAPGPVVGRFNAATQVMTFIRPIDSQNPNMPNEISAEQAHFVLQGPAGDGVAPWDNAQENKITYTTGTDPAFLFIRDYTSGTQSMIGQAILLDPKSFAGFNAGGTGAVITDVQAAVGSGDQQVMGIAVAGGGYDSKRSSVQALAVRGFQQTAAWLPDSTVATFDKRNVRSGLYTIFGPLQVLFNVDNSGKTDVSAATDQAAVTLVNYLSGATALPGGAAPIAQYEINASFVPDCAMGVTRFDNTGLGGNTEGAIVPNTARQHSCDCYFESHVTSPTTTCKSCSGASDCPGGVCGPNGVCEAF